MIKKFFLKRKFKRIYVKYKKMHSIFNSNIQLTKHIKPELYTMFKNLKAIYTELRELDPACPRITWLENK